MFSITPQGQREDTHPSHEVRLPQGVKSGDLKAKFADGILEITVPVPEIAKAKKIEIETKETETAR